MKNTQVTLFSRPMGKPQSSDFAVVDSEIAPLLGGQAMVKNLYISMDAGFRNWMDEDSGDEVLPAMPLGKAVMGLILGEVIESKNPNIEVGQHIMARLAWEQYSVIDDSDWLVTIDDKAHPLSYHLGVLGDTGMSAYFGLTDIGQPGPGDTVLISAAGGAVGSIAGQIAKLKGARVIGLAGSDGKCRRLENELGYDLGLNYKDTALSQRLGDACPDGINVYFDNVGGLLLETVLEHIAVGARIPFCGAVADYAREGMQGGPSNLFQLVTQCVRLQGFMTHMQLDRYPEARAQLSAWMASGEIKNHESMYDGVEQCGIAFSDMFAGNNFGKTVVHVAE
ncbi:MAG: NADPH-dependent curcumin reductase CurA [Halioglobus sp.]|jgi:NADPH-dependent curcumin reductase CurA